MTFLHDTADRRSFFDRLQASALPHRFPLPRFTLFALSAIVAGAALAFVT